MERLRPGPDVRAQRRQAIAERIHHAVSTATKHRDLPPGGAAGFQFPTGPKPGLAGFGWDRLPEAARLLQTWTGGDVPGAQVYVSVARRAVASFGLGWARDGLASTPDVVNAWLCCAKPILAIAFGQLWERGLVQPDTPVVEVVPEVGLDKRELTFRHLLSHSAPLRPDPVLRVLFAPRCEQLAAIAAAALTPDARPGLEAAYSHVWSWFLLAEAVERLDGRPFARYLEDAVFGPAGCELWAHLSPFEFSQLWPRLGLMFDLRGGARQAAEATSGPDVFQLRCPGMMGLATAAAFGKLYEALTAAHRGVAPRSILQSATVEALTRPDRFGCHDPHFKSVVSWGLGFMTEARIFGSHCSHRTFGHVGGLGLLTLVDPEADLVVCYALNGMIERDDSDRRDIVLVDAIYRDLGLASGPQAPMEPSAQL